MSKAIPQKAVDWRLKFFRKQLYIKTYRLFQHAREELKQKSSDLYEDMGLDSDEENLMNEWPEFFEIDSVENIAKFDLKPKPKLGSFKSMENMLQDYNIRDRLERSMSEYENGSNHEMNGSSNGIKGRSASVGPQESSAKSPMVAASDIMSQSMNSEHRESDIECLSQHGISA